MHSTEYSTDDGTEVEFANMLHSTRVFSMGGAIATVLFRDRCAGFTIHNQVLDPRSNMSSEIMETRGGPHSREDPIAFLPL